jgi:hypothetical protein
MAAKSKNKYDVFNWIKDKVIPSCVNWNQYETTDKLIWQFEKQYGDYKLTKELNTIRYLNMTIYESNIRI